MSKKKKNVLLAALLIALGFPMGSSAAFVKLGEQAATAANETIAEVFYLGGGNIVASGRVLGDLIAIGGSLVVGGPITVDGTFIGGSITILGPIGDDLRALGGNITVIFSL